MAKNKSEAARIAEEALPGWKAVSETSATQGEHESFAADDAQPNADSVMPTVDDLRQKYLGAAEAQMAGADSADDGIESDDAELVDLESGPLKKTVAVSKKNKKVIWSQG
jgi:hypothetical protein